MGSILSVSIYKIASQSYRMSRHNSGRDSKKGNSLKLKFYSMGFASSISMMGISSLIS
jgi:hypothetical protein